MSTVSMPPLTLLREQIIGCRRRTFSRFPSLRRDINDPVEYVGNVYDKAGWVLQCFGSQLGTRPFSVPSNIISKANRPSERVTVDLVKAIEESTGTKCRPIF